MAQKVNEAMLHELGINPYAASLLAKSYENVLANNLGTVGAVEFELHGIVISLRHPAHTKLVEGLPVEVVRAGVIQRFMQLAHEASGIMNLMDSSPLSKINVMMEDIIRKLDLCNQAIKENEPKLIALPTPEDLGFGDNIIPEPGDERPSIKFKHGVQDNGKPKDDDHDNVDGTRS